MLSPCIDLNDYNCSAVVDWLEFAMETPEIHQAVNAHRFLSNALMALGSKSTVHVSGPNRETGYKGHSFIVRIQQPRPRDVLRLMQQAVRHYNIDVAGIGCLPVRGIEVSVDFKIRANRELPSDERDIKRWQIQDLLWRHLRVVPSFSELKNCSPRFTREGPKRTRADFVVQQTTPKPASVISTAGIKGKQASALMLSAYHQPHLDMTYYVGSNQESVLLRVMDKRSDRRDPSRTSRDELPEKEWRARIEVSLLGAHGVVGVPEALGVGTVRDLVGFKFREVRKLVFEFYVPTFDGDGDVPISGLRTSVTELEAFRRGGVYGLDRFHQSLNEVATQTDLLDDDSLYAQPLGKKGRLVSYTALNGKVDRALKALETRWGG